MDDLVDASLLVPGLIVDVRYARAENVFGRPVYDAAVFALRRSVAELLALVQRDLAAEGLGLIAFDGYRPIAVQRLMWEICPTPGYVAPPERGSNHNRGTAVDVSLARGGVALPMPSAFDDFSERAHHDGPHATPEQRANAARLKAAMLARGFTANRMEWWHYDAPDPKRFEPADLPLSALKGRA